MIHTATRLRTALQHKIDNKTKPPGALGRLEEIALQVGLIQGSVHPRISHPYIVVFAGDHGIAATGLVNPFPQAVTAQMVLNFLAGGAAINVFSRQHGIGLRVVDAGVNFDFPAEPAAGKGGAATDGGAARGGAAATGHVKQPVLCRAKIGYGTRNYLEGDAMSREEVLRAIAAGKEIVADLFREGCNCIGFGEMGIGNTSSAALIMSFVTGIPVEECAGRGTGVNDEQLEKKKQVLGEVYRKHASAVRSSSAGKGSLATGNGSAAGDLSAPGSAGAEQVPDPLMILQQVGGFEIAMMVGAYLEAAASDMIILVDGFIATAALLLALQLKPGVQDHCIFSHTSGEQGHEKMLQFLCARPLLNLGMRLGEGTGAAMAFPLVQSAVLFLAEMASFESAGVSNK